MIKLPLAARVVCQIQWRKEDRGASIHHLHGWCGGGAVVGGLGGGLSPFCQ